MRHSAQIDARRGARLARADQPPLARALGVVASMLRRMHRPIEGIDGELVDLFMELIDRETQADPHWWYNLGALSGVHIGLYARRDTSRALLMAAFRERIGDLLVAELSEPFLIKHLKGDLDDWFATRGDTSVWDSKVDDMRQHMQNVIDDPEVRARWRDTLARNNREWADKSDEEMIADARRTLENSVTTRKATAEDATQRWAEADEWKALSEELLPTEIFEHWTHLSIQRGLDEERRR